MYLLKLIKRSLFHHNKRIRLCERYKLKDMLGLKPNKKEFLAMSEQLERTTIK